MFQKMNYPVFNLNFVILENCSQGLEWNLFRDIIELHKWGLPQLDMLFMHYV